LLYSARPHVKDEDRLASFGIDPGGGDAVPVAG
jgi:hypothetical protein